MKTAAQFDGDLWRALSAAVDAVDRVTPRGDRIHTAGRIARVFLWAVFHERPVYWACRREHWRGVKPPRKLPSQSTMSRRLRRSDFAEFLERVGDDLAQPQRDALFLLLDGMPLTVARHSRDRDATFGRGAGGINRGYKFHAVYGRGPYPLLYRVEPLNVDERPTACVMMKQLAERAPGGGYVLADANYDDNKLFDAAGEAGRQLVAPRRCDRDCGLGHRPHSPRRLRCIEMIQAPTDYGDHLLHLRRRIETRFGNLSGFGGGLTHLPPWVRGLTRVRLYVTAKLLIRAARDLVRKPAPTAVDA